MRGKWRNCLKAAERADAKVRVCDEDADLARFGDIHTELMGRKRFDVDLDVDVYRAHAPVTRAATRSRPA